MIDTIFTRMRLIVIFLCLSIGVSLDSYSQCNEYGYVQEYKGAKPKTPLGGVELSIIGAQSTISNTNGSFVLKFTTGKPGQAIRYNDIYKSGYVIFNKDAVGAWRISNNKRPFYIVMCKENDFRELKKKFYGIIEKSYKGDYLRQKALVQQKKKDALLLEQELRKLENEYQEKLSNINTYVEIFSRIDRSEMDEGQRKAIQLVEEGKITEAIAEYEKLDFDKKTDEQIEKLSAAEEVIKAGETMQEEATEDLLMLSDKLQQQIGMYELGGFKYDSVKIATIQKVVNVYHKLNSLTKHNFKEEEGKWLVILGKTEWDEKAMFERFKVAANLPSFNGLIAYADYCYYHTPFASHFAIDAQQSYQKAISIAKDTGVDKAVVDSLVAIYKTLPDFCEPVESGDSLCFQITDSTKNEVVIVPRTDFAYNVLGEEVVILDNIHHNGKKYKIKSVVRNALDNNRLLRKLTISKKIDGSINGCTNVDTLIDGKKVKKMERENNFVHHVEVIKQDSVNDKTNLQNYVDIVQIVARSNMNMLLNATAWPEYEEILSIGIIAIQDLIKNATRQQLQKLNSFYLGTVIGWAIDNELSIRYPWFGKIYPIIDMAKDNDDEFGRTSVRTRTWRTSYNLYQQIFNEKEPILLTLQEPIFLEIKQFGDCINKAFNEMPEGIKELAKDIICSNMLIKEILYKHKVDLRKYNNVLDFVVSVSFNIYDADTLKYSEKNDKKQVDNTYKYWLDQKKKYVSIVKAVANNEYKFLSEYIESEELLSIGMIAIHVMMKNKTPEQLAKHNESYIAAAVRWAIRNELRISKVWYRIYEKKMELEEVEIGNMKKYAVRLAIYQTVWEISGGFNEMDEEDKVNVANIVKIAGVLEDCLKIMDEKKRQLAVDLLVGCSLNKLSKTYKLSSGATEKEVIGILDVFKKNLDDARINVF